jgi:DNA-binding MarR family transcriptional regulator
MSVLCGFPRQVVHPPSPSPSPGRSLAEYRPNPAHRRVKLLAPTEQGRAVIARIDPGHAAFADRLAKAFGEAELADAVRLLERLSTVLDTLTAPVTEP